MNQHCKEPSKPQNNVKPSKPCKHLILNLSNYPKIYLSAVQQRSIFHTMKLLQAFSCILNTQLFPYRKQQHSYGKYTISYCIVSERIYSMLIPRQVCSPFTVP
eukprot:c35904_g1_i1 orf=52-360(+)